MAASMAPFTGVDTMESTEPQPGRVSRIAMSKGVMVQGVRCAEPAGVKLIPQVVLHQMVGDDASVLIAAGDEPGCIVVRCGELEGIAAFAHFIVNKVE